MTTPAEHLHRVSLIADVAARVLPGPAGIVAGIIREAISLGADLAMVGADPIKEIRRIRDVEPLLAGVHKNWLTKIRGQWGALPSDYVGSELDDAAFYDAIGADPAADTEPGGGGS